MPGRQQFITWAETWRAGWTQIAVTVKQASKASIHATTLAKQAQRGARESTPGAAPTTSEEHLFTET